VRKRSRARRRWLIGAFAVLFLYTIAGFFLVPAIAKGQIVATLEATFQRPVTLAELRFNPFTHQCRCDPRSADD
jgi:hypothetical protein